MKKILAFVLTAVLLLGVLPGALAAGYETPDYNEWLENWKSENPERVKEILKDEPPLYEEYDYATREEMLADWEISQSEYDDMVVYERAWDIYYTDYYQKEFDNWIADTREELGGAREGLGVMLNDAYIAFPDAQPEITNGRTMIPLRALMEAMGAEVSYLDDGTVKCLLNGTALSFKVGDTTVTAERDGKTTTIAMDCASYLKDGRTYVPVRFFAEAAGCDVLWDSDFQTAVVLDRSAIVSEIDKSFTIINKVLARAAREGCYQTVVDVNAAITAFSTLDGDTTSNVRGRITVVSDGKAQSISAVLDVYGLLELAGKAMDTDLAAQLTPEEIAALRSVTFDMIVNGDEGVSYLKCPLLLEIIGAEDVNAWLESDIATVADELTGTDFPEQLALGTMGTQIYERALNVSQHYDYAVFAWKNIHTVAESYAAAAGDSAFTPTGGGYALSFDRDDYEMISYGQLPESGGYDYKELDIRLTVTDAGGVSGSFTVRESGGDTRFSGTFSMTASAMSLNMEIHVDNTMKLQLSVTASTQPSASAVPAAPPAGSTVITADQLGY